MANKYEESLKNLSKRLPSQKLSTEQRTKMWNGIQEHIDHPESHKPRRPIPKSLWAATVAAILAFIIFVPIISRFSGGIPGASLQKTIDQSILKDHKIYVKHVVSGGILVFYRPTNKKAIGSQLGIEYFKKTLWGGWKVTKYAGGYGTSITQAFYAF